MKIKPTLYLTSFVLFTLLFTLTSCEPPSFLSVSKTTPIYFESTAPSSSTTPSPSLTATATQTLTNTPSPTAENTSTATITPTMTPTQFYGFEDARVFQSYVDYSGTTFYFIVPGVAAPYYGTVDGYDLTCESDPNQENLLICRAEESLFGTNLKDFEFFTDEDHTFLVYEGAFVTYLHIIPATPTPAGFIWPRADFSPADVAWGYTPPDCKERGVNLTCEIEYRLYEDNSCLVGMSCFDSCGHYYSVDTIKSRSGDFTFSGPCW
jgi:hypothetical protein